MAIFHHDGLRHHVRDEGDGLPFVFQHGLGGDVNQPFGLYRALEGVRLIGFDMRAHGETWPLGDIEKWTIAEFADDLVALLDHLRIERALVGGISLGAAVAVNAALRYPARVLGLVLVRPAWIDHPLPDNVTRYQTIARMIREYGPREGLARFRATDAFQAMERESPDCAKSLVGQFEHPRAAECVARLERLATDTPCTDRALYAKLSLRTLVVGNRMDPIHPWELAQSLARLIPGAMLREVAPKSVGLELHAAGVQTAIDDFLIPDDHC